MESLHTDAQRQASGLKPKTNVTGEVEVGNPVVESLYFCCTTIGSTDKSQYDSGSNIVPTIFHTMFKDERLTTTSHNNPHHVEEKGAIQNKAISTDRSAIEKSTQYKCLECGHVTQSEKECWGHANEHISKGKQQLRCNQCDFVTEHKHHLENHILNHEKPKVQCDKCGYECVNESMLNSHKKSHASPEYPFKCQDCTYKTNYEHSLKMHLMKYGHRREPGNAKNDINEAPNIIVDKIQLKNDEVKKEEPKSGHVSSEYLFKCQDCTYVTNYEHSLKMHLMKYGHRREPGNDRMKLDRTEALSKNDGMKEQKIPGPPVTSSTNYVDNQVANQLLDQQQLQSPTSKNGVSEIQIGEQSHQDTKQFSSQIGADKCILPSENVVRFTCPECNFTTGSNGEIIEHLTNHLVSNQQQSAEILSELQFIRSRMEQNLSKMQKLVQQHSNSSKMGNSGFFTDDPTEQVKQKKCNEVRDDLPGSNPAIAPTANETTTKALVIHGNIFCDGCGLDPLYGVRYKCLQCPDFDLCEGCERKGLHAHHLMVRIPNPEVKKQYRDWVTNIKASNQPEANLPQKEHQKAKKVPAKEEGCQKLDAVLQKRDLSLPERISEEEKLRFINEYFEPADHCNNFSEMIANAIQRSERKKLTLMEIYAAVLDQSPHFKDHPLKSQYQNDIRMALSLNDGFVKLPKRPEEPFIEKDVFWTLKTICEYVLQKEQENEEKVLDSLKGNEIEDKVNFQRYDPLKPLVVTSFKIHHIEREKGVKTWRCVCAKKLTSQRSWCKGRAETANDDSQGLSKGDHNHAPEHIDAELEYFKSQLIVAAIKFPNANLDDLIDKAVVLMSPGLNFGGSRESLKKALTVARTAAENRNFKMKKYKDLCSNESVGAQCICRCQICCSMEQQRKAHLKEHEKPANQPKQQQKNGVSEDITEKVSLQSAVQQGNGKTAQEPFKKAIDDSSNLEQKLSTLSIESPTGAIGKQNDDIVAEKEEEEDEDFEMISLAECLESSTLEQKEQLQLKQSATDKNQIYDSEISDNEFEESCDKLTAVHLRKAKLIFFYTRYPSSQLLKSYFPDVSFDKSLTAQLVKWFSNFREFFYMQMEKFSKQALAEGIRNSQDIHVTVDSEIYKIINQHYNRQNYIIPPPGLRETVEKILRFFFDAIQQGRDADPSWNKLIYKEVLSMDSQIPDWFRARSFDKILQD